MQVAELFAKLGLQVDKKSWSVGNDVIAGLGKALAVWAGAKVISSIAGVVDEVQDLGGRLDDLAQQTGISAEGLQEVGFAAKMSGSDMDTAVTGAKVFGKQLNELAATGKGPLADGLSAINLSYSTVKKSLADKGFLGPLGLVADKLADMPDGLKKSAIAQKIFGKAGADLIPLLNNGSAGIEKLAARAHELGVVMSNEDVSKLAEFGDTLDEVKLSWQGIKQQAVVALLPALKEMLDGLLKWVTANRELIKGKLVSFINALAAALTFLGKAVAFVVEHWEVFAAAIAGASVVTALIRIIKFVEWLKLASTAAAAKTALAWVAAAAPFVLMAAGVGAVIYALIKYKKQAREVFNWIIGQLVAALNWITSLPGRAIAALVRLGELIKTKIGEAWDWVKQKAEETWEYIMDIPSKIKDWALDKVGLGSDDPEQVWSGPVRGRPSTLRQSRNAGPAVQITNGPITVEVKQDAQPADYYNEVRRAVEEGQANMLNHGLADAGEDE